MSTVSINAAKTEPGSCSRVPRRCFGDLRGVQWRIDLGILPSCPLASIDDLRRVTADSRRRYAALRRQLLVDTHVPKDGSTSPDFVIDNPLSQNPDSMWGRFFRNAELERMVDQDLTRLYPERIGYFQESSCQAILRRILLLWCLRHPEYGYRQGMHELLAPLLYVLHVDAQRLSEICKIHDDHFPDKFDTFSFHENDLSYKFDFKKFSDPTDDDPTDATGSPNVSPARARTPDELDPKTRTLVLLSDSYGAEGELGIVASEKFLEHDAYAMFDSLLGGGGGALAMSDFFIHSPSGGSHSPVIEASVALYHLLSISDPSLHAHLVELGVEPQYFALRWLRVLFGREFSLEDLLSVWDEIFARKNTKTGSGPANFGILESHRGAFVCAFGISMILHLRSSLLATENATVCLQRLLNFPDDVGIEKLLDKAEQLHELALRSNDSASVPVRSVLANRGHSLSLDSASTGTIPLSMVADSYWEEKWRVLHKDKKEEQHKKVEEVPYRKKGWSEKVGFRLSRTESDPIPSKKKERNRIPRPSVRRNLLEDLARQLGSDEGQDVVIECNQDNSEHLQESIEVSAVVEDVVTADKNNYEIASSEESSSSFSDESEISVRSNSLVDDNDSVSCVTNLECSPLPLSDPPEGLSSQIMENGESLEKLAIGAPPKERKVLSSKFQWLWKFGRNGGEGTSERTSGSMDGKGLNGDGHEAVGVSSGAGCEHSCGTSKGETVDQNLMVSLKNLGQSMLENIQVIESVFQQDNRNQTVSLENLSKNGLVGKGQVTAMAALKELRKISNLLSEM
ncbi:Ypt/Rab-GAP domain of gyp1p superfamily protein [Striga hermonthica]|uniref:Ypt/Rab-GAP domain of gyp1p superfamily protein n=1 Tax=Striga hermonthica TaxID=68872 RepID=A0A9N7RAF6_STRHE|nr:Ypt/Rab-GAP domain of gyp1p superfamily protein [Striga hermonthica]